MKSKIATFEDHVPIELALARQAECSNVLIGRHSEAVGRRIRSIVRNTIRALALLGALANPFFWLPQITAAQAPPTEAKTGGVQGTVFVADQDGGRSVVPG